MTSTVPRSTAIPRTVRVSAPKWHAAVDKARSERNTLSEVVRHALDLYLAGTLPK